MPRVKLLSVAFLAAAVLLSSCNTLANRRDMYRNKGDGPYTKKIKKESGIVGPTI